MGWNRLQNGLKKILGYIMNNKSLIKRILEISFKNKTGHIGSCLNTLDILDSIYKLRKKDEPVVLSNGHAGLSLYVVLEKYGFTNAESLSIKHGTHPNRDLENGIYVSTGSLGYGLPIAVGMSIADKNRNVYCVISDGECAEGSIWESIRVASEQKLNNLKIVVSANGYGGYDQIKIESLPSKFSLFGCLVNEADGHNQKSLEKILKISRGNKPHVIFARTKSERLSFLKGLDAHYKVMNELDYSTALKELNL